MARTPVVFIHGLWIHSSAWAPWVELFTERGYDAHAPGWPGDGETVADTRAAASALDDVGITQICRHYADFIETLDTKPIVIGTRSVVSSPRNSSPTTLRSLPSRSIPRPSRA